jgi:hypothetical protein
MTILPYLALSSTIYMPCASTQAVNLIRRGVKTGAFLAENVGTSGT